MKCVHSSPDGIARRLEDEMAMNIEIFGQVDRDPGLDGRIDGRPPRLLPETEIGLQFGRAFDLNQRQDFRSRVFNRRRQT